VSCPSTMDGHSRFSVQQNYHTTSSSQTLAHYSFHFPVSSLPEPSERERWLTRLSVGGVAPSCVCLLVGDAHPRVVTGDQRCGGVTFPESNEVRSGDGWPKVSPGVPHLLLGFETWGFLSICLQFSSFLSNLNPFLNSSCGKTLDLSIKWVRLSGPKP
jgi:hypothetical protein